MGGADENSVDDDALAALHALQVEAAAVVRPKPPRWVLPALVVPIIGLVIATNVGNALGSSLVKRHPLLLITLNATNKWLILASNHLDALSYYAVGGLRLVVADPLFYLLGLFYGDAALRWLERKMGDGAKAYTWFEKAFAKARYPMVIVAPNNIVCLLAGASGMPVPAFFACNIIGTAGRLFLIRLLGKEFNAPVEAVTNFLDRYRWPLTAISVGLVVLNLLINRRKGTGELDELRSLEAEIEKGTSPVD